MPAGVPERFGQAASPARGRSGTEPGYSRPEGRSCGGRILVTESQRLPFRKSEAATSELLLARGEDGGTDPAGEAVQALSERKRSAPSGPWTLVIVAVAEASAAGLGRQTAVARQEGRGLPETGAVSLKPLPRSRPQQRKRLDSPAMP
ncbi:MAG: hypothetical protein LBT40_04850 [Deltaproteobacteria bacterium]|nr:hypothetical protein [Deltaproteobacteria bacterium]